MRYDVPAILNFLKELKYNNSVEWMHAHQPEYKQLVQSKSWSLYQSVSEKELLDENFPERVIESYRIAKPWNDFINEALVDSGVKLTW